MLFKKTKEDKRDVEIPRQVKWKRPNGRSVAAKLKNNKKPKQGHCVSIGSRAAAVCSLGVGRSLSDRTRPKIDSTRIYDCATTATRIHFASFHYPFNSITTRETVEDFFLKKSRKIRNNFLKNQMKFEIFF